MVNQAATRKALTEQDKYLLEKMRRSGITYSEISARIGIKESSVRTYCSRHGLTDEALLSKANRSPEGFCPNCGLPILQVVKQKPKRFCSDQCRYAWWSKNRICMKRSAFYTLRCHHCGKEFVSYGNNKRKYCSHECYIEERFGAAALPDSEGAV